MLTIGVWILSITVLALVIIVAPIALLCYNIVFNNTPFDEEE